MSERFNDKKIIGYALLIAGICIMGFSIASVIGVFMSGDVPIEILHAEETTTTQQGTINVSEEGEVSVPMDFSQMMTPMFPLFNLLAYITIAFFLVAAGGRVARLGIHMMKVSLPDAKVIKPGKADKKGSDIKIKE